MAAARPGARDEFNDDFTSDVMPYVEKNYRVLADRAHRAIAGLSMGGGQTLTAFIGHPDAFAYVGVFSSGVFGIVPPTRPRRRPGAAAATAGTELGRAASGCPRQRGVQEGPEGVLVQHGFGRRPHADDQGNRRDVQEARVRCGVQGESGRSHLAELAQLPGRVHAAAVPGRRRPHPHQPVAPVRDRAAGVRPLHRRSAVKPSVVALLIVTAVVMDQRPGGQTPPSPTPAPASALNMQPVEMPLWENGAPGRLGDTDADTPTLTVYHAARVATGTGVIVAPGGGYGALAMDHEGRQVASWFNAMGVTAFVLRYRLGPGTTIRSSSATRNAPSASCAPRPTRSAC